MAACRQPHPFLILDLSDRPSRNAMRLIASGERPSSLAASSKETVDLASSIKRRSSLNDQGFRTITKLILSRHNDKAAKRTPVRSTALLGAGPWGSPVQRGIGN